MNYEEVFCELTEPLDLKKAQIEAQRCYYCYDAPCIQACPTNIDIPSFIRKIGNQNIRGAAMDILSANILGGTCARACPVETLCQQACVREKSEQKPVSIGALQRFATDEFFKTGEKPFKQGKSTGKSVAVVGAGPAGLSCAHKLATLGHKVTIFEAREKSGGLNEYGLAPYKLTNNFAQKEVDFVLSVGGITIQNGKALGDNLKLKDLQNQHDAVFLGIGLGDVNALNLENESLPGVIDAVDYIAKIRQTKDTKKIEVSQNVVVIGGGNTAIDIAVEMKKLGAEHVTLVYRRGEEQMGATGHEQEIAKSHGVLIKTWAMPVKLNAVSGKLDSLDFERTELDSKGKLVGTKKTFTVKAGQVFKAIGQKLATTKLAAELKNIEVAGGKITVNEHYETSLTKVFAGGDCIGPGEDLTVTAVQQGKLAALAIHKRLGGG